MKYDNLKSAAAEAFSCLKPGEYLFDGIDYWGRDDLLAEADAREVADSYKVDKKGSIYIGTNKLPLYRVATKDDTKWGTQLAYHRHYAGLTQGELAAKSGVHINQIGKLERGEASPLNITLKTALALADALGVEPGDLI